MRSASDQLVKRAAHLAKCAVRVINAEHRNSNLLPLTNCTAHLAIGAKEVLKPGDTQLRGTGATHRMVSCNRVSRR